MAKSHQPRTRSRRGKSPMVGDVGGGSLARAQEYLQRARQLGRLESNVQQNIADMFRELEADVVVTPTPGPGQSDLHLTDCNAIIETKAKGKLDPRGAGSALGETQQGQLKRYLKAHVEEANTGLALSELADDPWHGLLTDGLAGFVYVYDHVAGTMKCLDGYCWEAHESSDVVVQRVQRFVNDVRKQKPWPPQQIYDVLRQHEQAIEQVYQRQVEDHDFHLDTKFALWLDRLRASGLAPSAVHSQHRLFIKHCFLVAVAKAVAAALSPDVDSGDWGGLDEGFTAWMINSQEGVKAVTDLFEHAKHFNWSAARRDVLQSLYEDCIDRQDRKIYGEYYTPDWLAGQLVEELLDDEWVENAVSAAIRARADNDIKALSGIGVLDPTCGSGTFLYHAALRIRQSHAIHQLSPGDAAHVVAMLIHGMDIHPVAVEMAKSSVLRALPAIPKGLQLNISQGDALFTYEGKTTDQDPKQVNLLGDVLSLRTPKQNHLVVPPALIHHPQASDFIHKLVDAAVMQKPVPPVVRKNIDANLRTFHQQLTSICRDEGNSVWAWHLHNMIHPLRLQQQRVDRILSNPPWVRVNEIQVPERKQLVVTLAKDAKLWTGGQNATGFDIAALFVCMCRKLYLNPINGNAAWLTNAAAIQSNNWKAFRSWHRMYCTECIDYSRMKERPFQGADACALVERRPKLQENDSSDGPAAIFEMQLNEDQHPVTSDATWNIAKSLLSKVPAPQPPSLNPSHYLPSIRNGATMFPHVLVRTSKSGIPSTPTSRKARAGKRGTLSRVQTVVPRRTQGNWAKIPSLVGEVPNRWLHPVIFSSNVLPFAVTKEVPYCIIPLSDECWLIERPEEQNEFWKIADGLYRKHRGRGAHTPNSLLTRIDHQRALSTQIANFQVPSHGQGALRLRNQPRRTPAEARSVLVVYNKSGNAIRAARIPPTIVDNGCYYYLASSQNEAAYLTAVLNAPCLQSAFRASKISPRHYDKQIWKHVPIPMYVATSKLHVSLVRACKQAESIVQGAGLADDGATKRVVQLLDETQQLARIDGLVKELLPDHVL